MKINNQKTKTREKYSSHKWKDNGAKEKQRDQRNGEGASVCIYRGFLGLGLGFLEEIFPEGCISAVHWRGWVRSRGMILTGFKCCLTYYNRIKWLAKVIISA